MHHYHGELGLYIVSVNLVPLGCTLRISCICAFEEGSAAFSVDRAEHIVVFHVAWHVAGKKDSIWDLSDASWALPRGDDKYLG